MKDSSKDFLLAEYDRLRGIEQHLLGIYDESLRFYLTVIGAMIAVFLLLAENYSDVNELRTNAVLLLGAILLLGEATYLRLIGEDLDLMAVSKRYQLIRDHFSKEDAELEDVFSRPMVESTERFRAWSSIGVILARALSITGVKTTVVLLNCIASIALTIFVFWPKTLWQGLAIGTAATVVVATIHATHASLRYRIAPKQLSEGVVISWWM